MRDITRGILKLLCLGVAGASAVSIQAATDKYDYDALGRVIRRIDDQNRATEYFYDPTGNITRVTGAAPAEPLSVTSTSLGSLRQNEIRQVSIVGSGLTGVQLRSSDPTVAVSNVIASAGTVSFKLSVAANAPLGAQTIYVENASGSAAVGLSVIAGMAYEIVPSPISVAPDSVARLFTFRLHENVSADTTFSLSTLSPSIARTKTSQIVIPAGQSQATFGVAGVSEGTTLLRVGGSSLVTPLESMVFVAPGASNRANFSPAVGIAKGVPWTVAPSTWSISGPVGIAKGLPWSVSPNAMTISGPIGIAKGLPSTVSPNGMTISGPIGIAKGLPWSVSSNAGPVIAPLVGISKP